MLNEKIRTVALKYLIEKQGQKGSEIEHFSIQMADYLSPNNTGLTIEEKQSMFSVINRMEQISYNFSHKKEIDQCFVDKPKLWNIFISVKYSILKNRNCHTDI